jgi:hypothetical protein
MNKEKEMYKNLPNNISFFKAYKEIINDTFILLVKKRNILIKALIIPFILLVIIDYYNKSFSVLNIRNIFTDFTLVFFLVLSLIISIIVAITTHRVLLLEKNAVPTWGFFKFGLREFKYLASSFIIGFLCIPFLLLLFIPIIGIPLTFIMVLIIFSRMSLVFPSIALNEEIGIWESWNKTKNYKLITFFSIIIFPIIITILLGLIYSLVINFLVNVISPYFDVLYVFLDLFITILVVSTLSATYKFIKKYTEEESIKIQQEELSILEKDGNFEISIPFIFDKTFEDMKEELLFHYEKSGFSNIVIDKENLWIIKNPQNQNAYISLSVGVNKFLIETYNVDKPQLSFVEI